MSLPPGPPEVDPQTHRALAVGLYNRAWALSQVPDRAPAQDDELVEAAHASAWHWRQVGNAANEARAHWLCSRVYATLGRAEPAVHHARRANDVVDAGGEGLEDWDAAAAAEAMARALSIAGRRDEAAEWKTMAMARLDAVGDDEDRAVILADLASVPV